MMRCLWFFLLIMTTGCSRVLSKDELVQSYQFSLDNSRQELRVKPDGKYVNVFYSQDKVVWSDQGDWTYDESSGQKGITLNRFRFGFPEYSLSERGFWFVVPEKSFIGTTLLCFDLDLNRCFESNR